LLPKEPELDPAERKRQLETLPPEMEAKLQERRRQEAAAARRAYGLAEEDPRLAELAERLARDELSVEAYGAAVRAIEEQRRQAPPPEPEPGPDTPWQHMDIEAQMWLRAVVSGGLPTETYLDPRSGRALDSWQIESEQRDTSLFLELGPCRAMGQSQEENPLPPNPFEEDPRLATRVVYRQRPPAVRLLPEDELEPLPAAEATRCPRHPDTALVLIDRTGTPTTALCEREEDGAVVRHDVIVRLEHDQWGREVVRASAPPTHNFELHEMTPQGLGKRVR
jgi:hypothetical protein